MSKLLLFFTAFFSCLISAEEMPAVHTATEITTDHVLLGRELSVAGHRLCHDGMHMYFKTEEQCRLHNSTMEPHGFETLDCSDLKLTPVNEIEQIKLTELGPSVYRFFTVDLFYRQEAREVSHMGQSEAVVTEHYVQVCDEFDSTRPTVFPENVWTQRNAAEEELDMLNELYQAGFEIIHSPAGVIENLLFADPILWSRSFANDMTKFSLGSPLCNDEFYSYFQKIGGEITGTSRPQLDLFILEEFADPLRATSDFTGRLQKASSRVVSCNPRVDI